MHPFEDAQEHMPASVSVMLRECFRIGQEGEGEEKTTSQDDKSSRCKRLFVPLMEENGTEQVFVKCMRKMFPKLTTLDDAGRKTLFKQSEGNPLFVREIADELMEVFKMNAKKIRLDKSETKLTYVSFTRFFLMFFFSLSHFTTHFPTLLPFSLYINGQIRSQSQ